MTYFEKFPKKIVFSNREKKRYRKILFFLLLINMGVMAGWYWMQMEQKIPNRIYLFQNQNAQLDWNVPLQGKCNAAKDVIAISNSTGNAGEQSFALDKTVSVTASTVGTYQAELKLFGIFHYKYIQFDVIEKEKVMPSGKAVGLYIRSEGIMVLGSCQVEGKDGFSYEPAKDILQPGDGILRVNGTSVKNINQIVELLQKNGNKKVKLEIKRGNNKIHLKLETVLGKDGIYKIGAWLREDTEGIGTVSFVTKKNQFAALGHGITDIDTGKLVNLNEGEVYKAYIQDIEKGKVGKPGELVGTVELGENSKIGTIQSNTNLGITGKVTRKAYSYQEEKSLPIGLKQQVTKGNAYILCQLGKKVEKYKVEIEEINVNSTDNKGMVLKITDKRLLKKAGGIVQGMSGAPIIQKNKMIGAVTHVFVNDPTGGYGTFVENML